MKKIILFTLLTVFCAISTCILFNFILFPTKYKNQIEKYSIKYNLSPALIASIINVESGYNKNAISKSNAKGLMQIMDTTAKEIAIKLNYSTYDIYNADTNIEFGCYYLNYLLNVYNNNLQLALSAYNAGITNVNNWVKNEEYFNGETLVKIPFKETKNYIKKIKMNNTVYQLKYR